MRDLSDLAKDAMWVTSQEGGGLVHDNTPAFSAPGTEPATPMPDKAEMANPTVTPAGERLPTGTPPRRIEAYTPSAAKWGPVDDGTPDTSTTWWRQPYGTPQSL